MGILGTLLKNKRAGEAALAWNRPALAGPEVLDLRSPDFAQAAAIPLANAGRRAGGANTSPALAWTTPPEGAAQLLLVVEDADSPTRAPFVHCVALLEPELDSLPTGALGSDGPAVGVRLLRSTMGRGYLGPEPIKGHGPHRYAFQLFALSEPLAPALGAAKPQDVLAAVRGPIAARGRLDGFYTR